MVACALAALGASAPAGARVAAASVALAPPTAAEETPSPGAASASPRQIGYPRAIPQLQTAAEMGRALQWARLPEGGAVAAVSVKSPGAAALRVGIRVGEVAPSAVLRFYGPRDLIPHELAGESLLAALERNRNAGESGADARTYWSPVVAGESIVIEVEVRSEGDRAALALTAPLLSHLTEAPDALAAGGAAAVFTTVGETYACPASLVVPTAGLQRAGLQSAGTTPPAAYLVTSAGCAASQAAASTLEAFWRPGEATNASGVGAALLYCSAQTDTALLVLDAPPRNAASLAHAPSPGMDPALEQWLGSAVTARAANAARAFSLP